MSSQPPRLEARVSAQERMQTILHARIEELSEDMLASFRQQAAYQTQFEQQVETRFNQVDARLDRIEAEIGTIKTDIGTIKSDMVAMEGRILNAFQQLVTIIDTRLPSQEK